MSKNFDLQEKVNLIYNFTYNKNNRNNYDLDKINIKNISMDDIKISSNEKIYTTNILSELFKGKFRLLEYFKPTNTTIIKRYSDYFPLTLIIAPYLKNKNANIINSPNNNDALFSYILSTLVLNNLTPHIMLPIVNIDVKFNQIVDILKTFPSYKNYMMQFQNEKISDLFSVRVKEHFFKSQILSNYLKENKNINIRALLFQVIHTLAVIQNKYPNFRHNNLNPSNIYLYLKKPSNKLIKYIYNNKKFYMPSQEFEIKISNFNNAVNYKNNDYFDIYYFINSLLNYIPLNNMDSESKNFINEILPKNKNSKKIMTPAKLLFHSYFKKYLVKSNKQFNTKINSEESYKSFLGNQSEISIKGIRQIKKNKKKYNKKNSKKNSKKNNKIIITGTRTTNRFNEQTGGYYKKPYRREKNTPFITNDERNVFKKRIDEQPKIREPPIIAEQKVYDTTKSKIPPKYPPSYIPVNQQYYPYHNMMLPYSQKANNIPIQKFYNINMANPTGDHSMLNNVYEDMLPGNPFSYSFNTIRERSQIVNFIRNIILENNDGEEMNITGGSNSLLSYIRLAELNPYAITNNPYKELSKGFMLYNAVYPIRYDQQKNTLNFSKQNTSLNVRIYQMSIGSDRCHRINKNINHENFDLWREIRYYEYIRENILKTKISPNFVNLLLYKIDTKSNINYKRLNNLRYKDNPNDILENLKKNDKKINSLHNLNNTKLLFFLKKKNTNGRLLNDRLAHKMIKDDEDNKNDLTRDSGKSLIALTESPNNNIIQWASPLYEPYGSIKKMVATGYHEKKVWKSILFQMIYACAILQEHEIFIKGLNLKDNVYIKDIFSDSTSIGHWIYQVDGIDFYVPNFGYIVLIDSKYKDIEKSSKTLNKLNSPKKDYKIVSSLFKENGNYNINNIRNDIFNVFNTMINPSNFNIGMKPEDEIIDLRQKMYNDKDTNIKNYLIKYFPEYTHNRVGSLLLK